MLSSDTEGDGLNDGAAVMMGIFLAATAALMAVKVMTLGLEAVVAGVLYQTVVKGVLLSMVLSAALAGTFKGLSGLFSEGEEPDEGLEKIMSFLGISGAAVEKMYSIGDAFIDAAKGKIGVYGYYIGIFLAFTGMLVEAATETLSGSLLHWAAGAAVVVRYLGWCTPCGF